VLLAPLHHLHLVLHLQDVGEEDHWNALGDGGGALALGLIASVDGHLVVGLLCL
jgi:hypothetical protein